ncbi:MAG: type II secretion system minor pseudopilin GspK [Burkholderiales bacterium]|nr:type II secretion system minor pseudopilin GspK [Limnohabitans sp.]
MTSNRKAQSGAALISAMLVVTLVATLASVALWQQWRHVEVESAERHRVQSSWLLNGALDWSRLILREDAMAGVAGSSGGNADHLAEPWALPLKEAKLSTFLAQDQQLREGDPEVFLSGQITDAQSRINLTNWFEASDGKVSAKMNEPMQLALVRLFNVLDLPRAELERLAAAWRAAAQSARLSNPAMGQASQGTASGASLLPQQVSQLQWLGLSADTVQRLSPYVTILPEVTPVNLNTASAEVIYATVPGLDLAAAQQFVQQRTRAHFSNLTDASKALGGKTLEARWHTVGTRFFEVWGRLRMEDRTQEETALILRDTGNVTFVWRQKIAGILPPSNRESLLQSSQP